MEQQGHRRRLRRRYPLSGLARNPRSYEERAATVPPVPYILFPASFDERLIEELSPSSVPPDWDFEPPTDSTKSIGDAWVSAASSPVLSVPSVIVPEERNYILNPGHDQFAQIQFGSPVPCKFDPRLL
jgi:RES domain